MTRYHRSYRVRGYLADAVEHVDDPRGRYDVLALIALLGFDRYAVAHWLAVLRDGPSRGMCAADLWPHRVTSWIRVVNGGPVYDLNGVARPGIRWP